MAGLADWVEVLPVPALVVPKPEVILMIRSQNKSLHVAVGDV